MGAFSDFIEGDSLKEWLTGQHRLVEAYRELINRMENKIATTLERIWQDEMSAEPADAKAAV